MPRKPSSVMRLLSGSRTCTSHGSKPATLTTTSHSPFEPSSRMIARRYLTSQPSSTHAARRSASTRACDASSDPPVPARRTRGSTAACPARTTSPPIGRAAPSRPRPAPPRRSRLPSRGSPPKSSRSHHLRVVHLHHQTQLLVEQELHHAALRRRLHHTAAVAAEAHL